MAGLKYNECIGSSYHLSDSKAACSTAVNCYPQKRDGDRWMMASVPGETQIATLGAAIRGMRNVEGRWFVVAGSTLYEVTTSGSSTVRGTLSSSAGFVGMAS